MFDIPKSILRKMLNLFHTAPAQLTESEAAIAARIVFCSLCDNVWLRRKKRLPERCPDCHRRAWNRPLLEAMIAANPTPPVPKKQQYVPPAPDTTAAPRQPLPDPQEIK